MRIVCCICRACILKARSMSARPVVASPANATRSSWPRAFVCTVIPFLFLLLWCVIVDTQHEDRPPLSRRVVPSALPFDHTRIHISAVIYVTKVVRLSAFSPTLFGFKIFVQQSGRARAGPRCYSLDEPIQIFGSALVDSWRGAVHTQQTVARRSRAAQFSAYPSARLCAHLLHAHKVSWSLPSGLCRRCINTKQALHECSLSAVRWRPVR